MTHLESSLISDASWRTLEQCFSYPRMELCSIWKAHKATKRAADQLVLPTSPLTRHRHFTQMANHSSYLMSGHREAAGCGEIFYSTTAFHPEAILPQAIPSWATLTILRVPLL